MGAADLTLSQIRNRCQLHAISLESERLTEAILENYDAYSLVRISEKPKLLLAPLLHNLLCLIMT